MFSAIKLRRAREIHAFILQLRLTQPTFDYRATKLLQGIIEADDAYIGGKPRKSNKGSDNEPSKRGRGTKKTPIIGAVERGGNVVARVAIELTGR